MNLGRMRLDRHAAGMEKHEKCLKKPLLENFEGRNNLG
jgi:hypothetical protein